ncbi:hypothetical protein ZIOFF_050223 [Zingiber officinale]|uniref:F-box domain-containing protein n=1 Tax=Zingiber officinale TaxID=94328 RepID=A0A8J5FIQ6_ZINOF|nr:hypothetical protein ZIOFF_050223 [Zingiber officinale]
MPFRLPDPTVETTAAKTVACDGVVEADHASSHPTRPWKVFIKNNTKTGHYRTVWHQGDLVNNLGTIARSGTKEKSVARQEQQPRELPSPKGVSFGRGCLPISVLNPTCEKDHLWLISRLECRLIPLGGGDDMAEGSDARAWEELIPDALGLIFRNLPLQEILTVIPRVCKSWSRVVLGPYCWQEIDIDEWSQHCKPEQLDKMLHMLIDRSCGSFRRLSVSGLHTESMFTLIAYHAGSLQRLELPRSEMNDAIVKLVAPRLCNLTYLDVSYCSKIVNTKKTWTGISSKGGCSKLQMELFLSAEMHKEGGCSLLQLELFLIYCKYHREMGLLFTNLKYSRVEIDEVRFEWAECMLDYI